MKLREGMTLIPTSVYYYIADIKGDQNIANLSQRFTIVVASDDAGKSEFLKRVLTSGLVYWDQTLAHLR